MNTLQKIEKRKETWFLLLIVFIFFLLQLPSLIEPLWYGDEGIYEVVAMALNNDRQLYSQIWDNKPPLLYIIYAAAHADQFTVRFLSLLIGAVSVIPFYYLSKNLFRVPKINSITTAVYVLFIATPFLEGNVANAENFMLLPIIASAFLVYKVSEIQVSNHKRISANLILNTKDSIIFIAGLLLGIAFLLKTVAIFDFAAFFLFISFIKPFNKQLIRILGIYTLGLLLPILVTVGFFAAQGNLADFIQATFFGNIDYVSYANILIIPQGFLIVKLLILFVAVMLIYKRRKLLPHSVIFIFLWFLFSLFNLIFSGRIWTHYLLIIAPCAVLMLGLLYYEKAKKLKNVAFGLLLLLIFISIAHFRINIETITNTAMYYQNFVFFIADKKSTVAYQDYFDKSVSRDYEIAQFIANKTEPEDTIFIWGNNPQIYVLSNKLPPGKYTVEYHINQNPKHIAETAEDIRRTKPKYVIILPEMNNFPFTIREYTNKYSLKGTDIYERTL